MQIILAGHNVDVSMMNQGATPETISAAYARISRDPRPIDALRASARLDVEKARRSNQTIIFDYGHSSVAEHATFNVDVIGVSRYAVEEIQKFRLLSYTEKSQRYVLLEDDFVVPKEVKETGFGSLFVRTIKMQNACYHALYKKLRPWVFEHHPQLAASRKTHKTLEGLAKEDARYVVSLATQSQIGMTLNARNLEHVISHCAAHPLAEVQEYARRLYASVKGVAPSLVKYTAPTPYNIHTRAALRETTSRLLEKAAAPPDAGGDVVLVDYTPNADALVTAALIHSSSGQPMSRCQEVAQSMNEEERKRFIASTFMFMGGHDSVLREFENVRCVFELTLSAACFGQLKRHRMATLNAQPYDVALGVTTPPSIIEAGAEAEFQVAISATNAAYKSIAAQAPEAAPYVLTNAHKRRVLFSVNARELYHVSRLREDPHAQWDIRDKATQMMQLAREVMPAVMQLAVGKHRFEESHAGLFPEETEKNSHEVANSSKGVGESLLKKAETNGHEVAPLRQHRPPAGLTERNLGFHMENSTE